VFVIYIFRNKIDKRTAGGAEVSAKTLGNLLPEPPDHLIFVIKLYAVMQLFPKIKWSGILPL